MNKILNNELKKIFNAQKKNINDNTMDMLIQQVYSDPDYYKIKAKYNRYKRLMNESNKATIMTPIISATNLKSNNDKKKMILKLRQELLSNERKYVNKFKNNLKLFLDNRYKISNNNLLEHRTGQHVGNEFCIACSQGTNHRHCRACRP
tara:strand:- start:47 stop:493 length:447 start_codon:yes stop_codon:yes gene_type:complete